MAATKKISIKEKAKEKLQQAYSAAEKTPAPHMQAQFIN